MQLRAEYSWINVDANRYYSAMSVPSSKGSCNFDWDILDFLHWNFNLYGQDKSPRDDNDPRDDLDAYILLNTTFSVQVNQFISLDFSTFNMTDEGYAYPAPPDTLKYDYTVAGRTFLFGLRLSY